MDNPVGKILMYPCNDHSDLGNQARMWTPIK